MKEFIKTAARDYIFVSGIYYFRYFNTNEMMMRHCVFATGISYQQVYNYLFVVQTDGRCLMFYLKGENEVMHGPICKEYKEPEYEKPVEYCLDGESWCKWNPFQ